MGEERIMKYALIGCGRIATNHIKAVLNNKDSLDWCYRFWLDKKLIVF